MKKLYAFLIVCFLTATATYAQDLEATTADGMKVTLHSDGTWSTGNVIARAGNFEKPSSSKEVLKGKRVKYSVRYDKSKWKLQNSNSNEDAEYQLEHTGGEGWAMIIPERIEMSLDALRQVAVENAKAVAADAQVISEDNRTVNGVNVRCLQINGTVDGYPITYYNYYYAGNAGSIQFITYTTQNLFEEYKSEFADLLNGFELTK